MRCKKARARRPLKQKWPPNRQVLLEPFLDSILPSVAVDQSPTKRICDRRAGFAATFQTACDSTTSEDCHLALGRPEPFDRKSAFNSGPTAASIEPTAKGVGTPYRRGPTVDQPK
ncbi:hypothetical protein OOU_Y34scaffold00588g4 [Pyricularia oryzae Y34]|uniref:Uncharacterized protein n=1 Tax=Pyricularia oryzae (strain Y34) TaxID=1143189 RepID=A0AA97NWK1_PYRO3|nr:hypothetical protein OOU_Y34scaffold00588g4 [Pyricularia oryzae Y34]